MPPTLLDRFGASLIALGLLMLAAFGIQVTLGASPASAGTACSTYGICGDVKHSAYSAVYRLKVTCAWGTGPDQYVVRGNWATCKDADGYYIPSGWCNTTVSDERGTLYQRGPNWFKISDNENVTVKIHGC